MFSATKASATQIQAGVIWGNKGLAIKDQVWSQDFSYLFDC